MAKSTRRAVLAALAGGAGMLGAGYALRGTGAVAGLSATLSGEGPRAPDSADRAAGGGMMGSGTMESAHRADMSTYMEMFDRHTEITRTVQEIPGGVRTTTESAAEDLAAQLQEHVSSMYTHLGKGEEVRCMSQSLPTLFRRADSYQRRFILTSRGVTVEETSADPAITDAIRAHAREVSGFVTEGMPAMMSSMMRSGS